MQFKHFILLSFCILSIGKIFSNLIKKNFEGLHSQRMKTLKNSKIKSKGNKISHGRGNSLRNKVRVWVDLDSPDPLKPLPTG